MDTGLARRALGAIIATILTVGATMLYAGNRADILATLFGWLPQSELISDSPENVWVRIDYECPGRLQYRESVFVKDEVAARAHAARNRDGCPATFMVLAKQG